MDYAEMKMPKLRSICNSRGLATSGTKATLIRRLEQQQPQQEVKQENEMQIDVIPQQTASLHVSESRTSHETLSNIKYEYETTHDELQAMEEIPASEELSLPQQSLEQDMSPNVEMSNEYPQSIDPVEQQQIDQFPTESSSPIVTHTDTSAVEVSSSSLEKKVHDHQPKPFDSLDKTYSTHDFQYEMIDRELLTRLISERKYGTQNLNSLKTLSKGIMMNQGQTNGVPYNYDLLLDIVQKSEIYKDGEIPDCLRHDYDPTFGTSYFGEPECVRNIGIPVEELFSFS